MECQHNVQDQCQTCEAPLRSQKRGTSDLDNATLVHRRASKLSESSSSPVVDRDRNRCKGDLQQQEQIGC